MDVNIQRDTNEKLQTSVYSKRTSGVRVSNFHSHHPNSAKIATISVLFKSVEMHLQNLDLEGKVKERSQLYQMMEMNGYSKAFVSRALHR